MKKLFKSTLLLVSFFSFPLIANVQDTKKTTKPTLDDFQELFYQKMPVARKQEIVNALLSEESKESIIDDQSKEGLDLASLIPALGSPQTVFGQKVLHDMVLNPSHDQANVARRQILIGNLSKNATLMAELEQAFAEIKEVEEDFLAFFEPTDDIFEEVSRQLYFGSWLKSLNDKPLALQTKQLVKYLYQSLSLIPPTIYSKMGEILGLYVNKVALDSARQNPEQRREIEKAAGIKIEEALRLNQQAFHDQGYDISSSTAFLVSLPLNLIKNTFKGMIDTHNPYQSSNFNGKNPKTLGDEITLYKDGWKKTMLCFWLWRGCMDIMWANRMKSSYQSLKMQDTFAQSLHKRTYNVARLVRAMSRIDNLFVNEYAISPFDALNQLCSRPQEISDELSSTVSLLSSSMLMDGKKFFALRGPALAGFTLVSKTKADWANALKALGEVEVYLNIARKLRDGEVCLSQTCEHERPYIGAVNYRNPVVKQCKPGTITIGDGQVNNILITGPHGCGKSTAQRSLAYNVVSAMVFGVAFADDFVFTPFNKILVYANIRDKAEEGLSSFMAECARIDSIEKTLASLKPYEFCLTLTDEVFKGTMEEEGARRYYAFCKNVCDIPGNILMSTTHFEKLVELEKDTDGKIRNFSVEVDELEEEYFERTYRLVQGESSWWFKDKKKRECFLSWLQTEIGC